ncbi:hypothetical protein ABIB74_001031 [Bradyrhizobium sp. F1.6.2]
MEILLPRADARRRADVPRTRQEATIRQWRRDFLVAQMSDSDIRGRQLPRISLSLMRATGSTKTH